MNHHLNHHPTFSEQEAKHNGVIKNFVENSTRTLTHLLQASNMKFKSCSRFTESGGVINSIFMVRATRLSNSNAKDEEIVELVLRISNTHEYWKRMSVLNEVNCIQLAEKHGIPVPKIVTYSADAENSPLGCEFILQERVEGQTLDNIWISLSKDQKRQVLEKLIVIVGKLHKIPNMGSKEGFLVGSLLENDESPLGPIIGDCAPLGPFKTLKEMVIGHLDFALDQLNNENEQAHYSHYLDFISIHAKPLLDLKTKLEQEINDEEDSQYYQFCHGDLNASNIMVKLDENLNTIDVTAILDWPQSRFTSVVKECETLSHWACLLELLNDPEAENELNHMETTIEDFQVRSKVIEYIVPIWEKNEIYVPLPEESTFSRHQMYLDVLYSLPRLYFFTTTWFHSEMKLGNFDLEIGYKGESLAGSEELAALLQSIPCCKQ